MLNPQLLQHLELCDERSEKLPNDDEADDSVRSTSRRSKSWQFNKPEDASDPPFDDATWTPKSIVTSALVALSISRLMEDRSFSLLRNLLWVSSFILLLWSVVPQWTRSTAQKTSSAQVEDSQPPETVALPLQHTTNGFASSDSQLIDVQCSIMSLLGSIGAPPPTCRSAGSGILPRPAPFNLDLLQTLTEEHVQLIRLVDTSIEWIKNGYRVRSGLFGCRSSVGMPTPILCAPSVERLEQANVSKLMQSGQATRPLPLSTLRNNLAQALMQQEAVLRQCLGEACPDSNDRSILTPPIVTIAWLRRQRQICVSLVFQVIDGAFDSLVEDEDKSVDQLYHAELTILFTHASNVAKQLHAYIQAGLPASVSQPAVDDSDCVELPEQDASMPALRQQSLALSVAVLCFHETLCSPDQCPRDRAFWWDKVRDHASNLSSSVQELDALMISNRARLEPGLPLPQDAESNPAALEMAARTLVNQEEEYVVVQHEMERLPVQETEPARGTSTLVYSGRERS